MITKVIKYVSDIADIEFETEEKAKDFEDKFRTIHAIGCELQSFLEADVNPDSIRNEILVRYDEALDETERIFRCKKGMFEHKNESDFWTDVLQKAREGNLNVEKLDRLIFALQLDMNLMENLETAMIIKVFYLIKHLVSNTTEIERN